MESDRKGQENTVHLDNGNRPRAPPIAKKPKPLPPKKPSLPAKPKKPDIQNGQSYEETPKIPPEAQTQNPLPQNTVPPARTPPQPPPKNSPNSSRQNRTPPPLPKNPPRGPKFKVPSEKSSEAATDTVKANQNGASFCNNNNNSKDNKIDKLTDNDSELPKHVNTQDSVQMNINTSTVNSSEGHISDTGPKQSITPVNGSMKSPPKVPLKPKPRPKVKEKPNDITNDQTSVKRVESQTNTTTGSNIEQSGNSTWFVAESHEKNTGVSDELNGKSMESDNTQEKQKPNISPKPSPKTPHKPLPKIPTKSSSVKSDFKEKRPDMTVSYSVDKGAVINQNMDTDSDIDKALDSDTFQHAYDNKNIQGNENKTNDSVETGGKENDKMETNTNNGVESKPQTLPKPVPRRSVSSGRPMPTPRKRLSINRLSGTEDTFNPDQLMASSVHNLSIENDLQSSDKEFLSTSREGIIKAKSEENVFRVSNEWNVVAPTIDIGDKDIGSDQNQTVDEDAKYQSSNVINKSPGKFPGKKSTEGTIVNSFVKSRVVFSDKGEEKQYRVIDKSVVTVATSQCHNSSESQKTSTVREQKESQSLTAHDGQKADSYEKSSSPVSLIKGTIRAESPIAKEKDLSPDNFDDLLSDRSILEPSSLLNEIEEILSRSHKHLSLTRSGSSPEKKVSPLMRVKNERSRSVDSNPNSIPVRPPRPKKEQKRVRAQSQVFYDSCGSDTESLPDTSAFTEDNMTLDERSLTLGRAKPHPPKPKRHKLLKVQRSQSDVTAMKGFVDKQSHKRQNSDGGSFMFTDQFEGADQDKLSPQRPKSWRKSRPTRKAPPPPPVAPYKSPPTNINMVIPALNTQTTKSGKKSKHLTDNTGGSVYDSIQDDDCGFSSEGEHDYHEIPEDMEKNSSTSSKFGQMVKIGDMDRDKTGSPPKLPPRNQNNSMTFETSSLSSYGHDCESILTGEVTSSTEDVSISSLKFPKTSSPNVAIKLITDDLENGIGLGQSPVGVKQRPPSGVSLQSDSGSGSHMTEHVSSSESDGDDEKKLETSTETSQIEIANKKERKLFMIVQEIASSEKVFVDVLNLLNVDFRQHISAATERHGRPVIPSETLNRIFDYLPQLQNFNEDLLRDLENRISSWDENKGIADIFVKKGPFLKLYSSYIRDFETMTATLDESLKKYPAFQAAVKEFESSSRCASLALKHYMLKPIQRIPQYRLLLQDYTKHLPENSAEMKDTQTALAIVSEVAHHANENMRHGDYVTKMLEIQRSLIGQFEVIKPGRTFLKEGELMKLSRKEMQPRFFFLFNDVLLYTTPVATGYRLNNVLPLAGMKVSVSAQDEFKTEFSIISVQRSFTLHSSNLEERDDWVSALNSAIEENAQKRNTFEAVRAGAQVMLDKDFVLGCKAPLWIPDARVTMCMLCTCEFTVTWRRHHCRACGRVVCGNCSDCKAPLRYLKFKPARVCDECYKNLKKDVEKADQEQLDHAELTTKDSEEGSSFLSIKNGLLGRFQRIRRSGRLEKKSILRPTRLVEVNANDEGASMSGYLSRWQKGKKWKRSWYLVKDKVLYTFKATQDTAAAESMVLLGYEVSRFSDYFEGIEPDLLFQLSHSNTAPIVFRTDSGTATEKLFKECSQNRDLFTLKADGGFDTATVVTHFRKMGERNERIVSDLTQPLYEEFITKVFIGMKKKINRLLSGL